MKRTIIAIVLGLFMVTGIKAQESDVYWTSGLEMIFSWADIQHESDPNNIMRWAPVINIQGMINVDFSDRAGFFSGLAIRNVGYIMDNYPVSEGGTEFNVKKKFRTYNLGIPVGLKFGNMDKAFLFGGYEIEFPFHYKEKEFRDEVKDKFTVWFTDRVEKFQHGFIVGVQFPYGTSLKFKYYLSEFHNQGFYESSTDTYPYKGLESHVFYFSLNFGLFRNGKPYYSEESSEYY